jgi:ribosomal protein S18 acetylase RimI-like enzyme
MPDVTLVPMTPQDLEAFIDEEVADYADERILEGAWSRRDALERARTALLMVVAWEHQAVDDERQQLWAALDTAGRRVGWLWVKLGPTGPWSTHAFLSQMTVARPFRHQGYGRSMLAALERKLADQGIGVLTLNVWESNLAAKRLYAAAGYKLAQQFSTMRQLRKYLLDEHGSGRRLTSKAAARVG